MRQTTSSVKGIKPSIYGTLYYKDGNNTQQTLTLRDTDFKSDTFRIRQGTSNSNEFTVGACVIGSLDFTLMNDTGKFDTIRNYWYDSRVSITLDFGDAGVVSLDYFWVVNHHENGPLISVECYDALKILDEYNLFELTQTYGLSFPCHVYDVLSALSQEHGFTFNNCAGYYDELVDPKNEQMTQRALLSYIAQMSGQYVKAYGVELRFEWYNMSNKHSAGTTFSHDLRTSDLTITGVTVKDTDDSTSQDFGSAGYRLLIENNPFITADNIATIGSRINTAVAGITYRPGDVDIMSDAAIEAGDVLLVNTRDEQNVTIIATHMTYKPQLRESLVSDSEPYAGDLRINRSTYMRKQAQKSINDELSNPNSDLSKALGKAGADSNFITISNYYQGSYAVPQSVGIMGYYGVIFTRSRDSSDNITFDMRHCVVTEFRIMPQGYTFDIPKFNEDVGTVIHFTIRMPVQVKVRWTHSQAGMQETVLEGYVDCDCAYELSYDGEVIWFDVSDRANFTTSLNVAAISLLQDQVMYASVPLKFLGDAHKQTYLLHDHDNVWNIINADDLPSI